MVCTLFTTERRRAGAALVARGIVVAGFALALAGCYATSRDTTASIPTDYRLRHPIAIEEGEHTMAVFIGTSRGSLNAEQRADVLAFARTWRRESTGGIIIDVPTGTANARAARDALHEVRSILVAAGVPPSGVRVRSYRPVSPRVLATIKLNYPKMVAEAGPCGLWPHDLGPNADKTYNSNQPYYNLGCASQRNLASMVDNPADLVQPRGETPASSARRSVMFDHYRKGEDSTTKYPPNNSAKLSDVGR